MTWLSRHMAGRQTVALLLGLVLAMRLVAAPFILSSPAPGIMAICSGGQIVYISMADGQQVQDVDGETPDPCPFFGIVSVLPGTDIPVAAPITLPAKILRGTQIAPIETAQPKRVYQPRAPPLLT